MSDENFAAGLAQIACREGDDLELYQDDRAANARKTSPGTSYAEVQKSNSKHKAKASASRKRSRDTSNNEPDSSAPPPKHPASGKQSVSRPITKPPAALNARRSRPDSTDSSGKEASLASSQPVGSSSVSPSAASPVSSAVEVSPRTGRPVRQQAARSSFRSSLQIELESADDREALNLANVVASIPSSDDESEDLPLAKLVVPPISCPETSPVPQQSTGVASEAQFTRETRVASISPREAVSEVPASLSFTAIEPHQSLVSPTTRVVIMTSLMMQSQMPSPRQHWFSPLVTNLKTTLLLVLLPSRRWSKVIQLILLITLPLLSVQHRWVAAALRLSQRLLRPLQLLQSLGLRLPRVALLAGLLGWWPLCRRL
ncbi:hypothetical protein PC112_g9810 [Phytophthora cactorum]|nr:hypothetical protein PC112_g9810 [Phytophthora cactorum]